jgi:hypothetical protein
MMQRFYALETANVSKAKVRLKYLEDKAETAFDSLLYRLPA